MIPASASKARLLASLPEAERRALLKSLSDRDCTALLHDWSFWGRPDQQIPDGNWRYWLILAGRGWGKTRTGAEAVRHVVERGLSKRIGLIAPTTYDTNEVLVSGPSGILAVSSPWCRPKWEPSKHLLTWPNGAIGNTFSAEEPERLRGPQHDFLWMDEIAVYPRLDSLWAMAMFGLRLGRPRAVLTTTPKPLPLLRKLLKRRSVHLTRGTTYDNRDNLATEYFEEIITEYEGTRLGRQELLAEMLDDTPGALWTRAMIDAARLSLDTVPDCARVVVAIDPAATSSDDADETGIIAAGMYLAGDRARAVVLEDGSLRDRPAEWARRAIAMYRRHKADCIVAEANNGGEMISEVIAAIDGTVPVRLVYASRGKVTRAEPVATLYEQGAVAHAPGADLLKLEDQMCTYVPGNKSPDRMDALVWAITELLIAGAPAMPSVMVDHELDGFSISPW